LKRRRVLATQFEGDALVFRLEFSAGGAAMKLRNVKRVTGTETLVSEEYMAMKDAPETCSCVSKRKK